MVSVKDKPLSSFGASHASVVPTKIAGTEVVITTMALA